MDYKPWMEYIKPEDMPNDDLRFLADTAGIESALKVILCSSGVTFTIPKNAFRAVKERYIIDKYDGTKYMLNKLTVECDMCQRQVYNIIERHLKK